MSRVVMIEHRHDRLASEIMKIADDAVVATNFKVDLHAGDLLCWLPLPGEPVDDQVQDLVTLIDQSVFLPQKIVMLSIAGTADDADSEQVKTWFGQQGPQWVMAHQYAIKMIDELELPYTIIRTLPLTDATTQSRLVAEGQPMIGDQVGIDQLVHLLSQILLTDRYRNQSIGLAAE